MLRIYSESYNDQYGKAINYYFIIVLQKKRLKHVLHDDCIIRISPKQLWEEQHSFEYVLYYLC